MELNLSKKTGHIRICLLILFLAAAMAVMPTAAADYHAGDVAVIVDIINNNGLAWDPSDPGSWYVNWNAESPQRITYLYLYDEGLTGTLDVEDLDELKELYCLDNDLTALGTLPGTLEHLDCSGNGLTTLGTLPAGLLFLDCSRNSLETLETLPDTLEQLNCFDNQLETLENLPTGLIVLGCSWNQLGTLGTLPDTLEYLACSDNQLETLGTLPGSLEFLDCSWNQLTTLENLPTGLIVLGCSWNQLETLEDLPDTLEHLYCSENQLTHLNIENLPLHELYIAGNPIQDFTAPDGKKLSITAPGSVFGTSWESYGYFLDDKEISLTAVPDRGEMFLEWEIDPSSVTLTAGSVTDTEISFELDQDITVTPKFIPVVYDPDDVAVINNIISNNELGWTYDDPGSWMYVDWSADIMQPTQRIIRLNLYDEGLTGTLDVEDLDKLEELNCGHNSITGLVLPGNLKVLDCFDNQLTDLGTLPDSLEYLDCSWNQLETLENLPDTLEYLYCSENQLTKLDIESLPLYELYIAGNPIQDFTAPDGNKLTITATGFVFGVPGEWNNGYFLDDKEISLTAVPDRGMIFSEWEIDPSSVTLTAGSVTDAEISFELNQDITVTPKFIPVVYDPDDVAVINNIISNNGLGWTYDDPGSWMYVDWSADIMQPTQRIIRINLYGEDLTGTLDVEDLDELEELNCGYNSITGLALPGNLKVLYCYDNQLTDLGTLPGNLEYLDCSGNQLTTLENLPTGLMTLSCSNNLLIDLGTLPGSLEYLDCSWNQLGTLENLPTGLMTLYCDDNKLTRLNINGLLSLDEAYVAGNPIRDFTAPDGNKLTITAPGAVFGIPGEWIYGYSLYDKEVTLTAVPDSGKTFSRWEIDPSVPLTAGSLTDAEISFKLNQDITVTPIFTESGRGSGTGSATIRQGSESQNTVQTPTDNPQPQTDTPQNQNEQPSQSDSDGTKSSGMSRTPIIIVGIMVLMMIAGAAVYFYGKNKN